MKILITNHFPLKGSGSGVYVTNIAKELVKKGHEVCIIMPENTLGLDKVENVKTHPVYFKHIEEIEGQVNFNFLCFDSHPRSPMLFPDATEEQIKEYEEAFRKAIEYEIKEFKPDVIHSQHIWIITAVAAEFGIPVITTCHGSDLMGYNDWSNFHNYTKKAAEGSKKIIAISNRNNEKLSNIYGKEKVMTMSNGYNPDMFYKEEYNKEEVLKSFNIDKNYKKVICFAGRLNPNKGVDILFNSLKLCNNNDIITLIAGNGQGFEPLNKMREELGLDNVKLIGEQSHSNLRKMYNISDLCVIPSREEAFGLVALEAIACGTPVVATNQGGMPDFITKEVGILVEKENVKELSSAINEIIEERIKFDPNYLHKYAKEKYSQEAFIDALIKEYENAINKE